jgi:hypothetical protein
MTQFVTSCGTIASVEAVSNTVRPELQLCAEALAGEDVRVMRRACFEAIAVFEAAVGGEPL